VTKQIFKNGGGQKGMARTEAGQNREGGGVTERTIGSALVNFGTEKKKKGRERWANQFYQSI